MAKISSILILIIIIIAFQLNSCSCQVNNSNNESSIGLKESLEIEKLQLEIQKIKQDVESQGQNSLRQDGTLFAALFAAIVALWSAWSSRKSQIETLNSQVKQYQKERISAFLRDLGNDKVAVRLGAIQALSNITDDNTDIIVSFLINLLKVESEPRIIEAISTAILNVPTCSLPYLLDASKSISERRKRFAIDLVLSKKDIKNVAEIFSVSSRLIEKWMLDPQVKQRKELLKLELLSETHKGEGEESIYQKRAENIIKEYQNLCLESNIIVTAVSKIIRKLSTYDEHFSFNGVYLPGIILNDIDISFFDFSESDLRYAQFENSNFKNMRFLGCDLSDSSFRDAIIFESAFDESILDKADLSRTKITKTSFNGLRGDNTNFDGSKLKGDMFDRIHLSRSGFEGAEFDNTNFEESTLYNCVFSGAVIKNLAFKKANLDNTNLSSIKLIENAKFIDTSFTSNSMNNSDFSSVCFIRSSFGNISNFSSSNFVGSRWEMPTFKRGTDSFKAYLIKNRVIKN